MVRLGVPLLDEYLEFLAGRCRPNRVLAVAYDLKVFFTVVAKPPGRVRPVDVLAFMTAQRAGGDGRLQVAGDGAGGVWARTLRRRLSSVSGLYGFLHTRGDVSVNPVPRGLPTRRERQRPGQGVPLVRAPRTLPRILEPGEVDALTAALRSHGDRAMIAAMVLGGLRRCEVLGLRLGDLRFGERRVFIAEGKGGYQRLVPVSARFFTEVSAYLDAERPAGAATDPVFTVLKDRRRGQPLTAAGLDEILDGARRRDGLAHAACHQLRHTCLTRLQGRDEPGSGAGPGRARLDRVHPHLPLHLGDDWLASQYRRAAEAIDAQALTAAALRVPGDRAGAAAGLAAAGRGDPADRRPDAPLPGAGRLCAAAGQRQRCGPGASPRSSPRHPRRPASLTQVTRRHVEDFRPWLAALPGQNRPWLTTATIARRLGTLRLFFLHIEKWGWDEAPPRVPMFPGDLPRPGRPLPRALDDGAAARLLRAAQDDRRMLVRVTVEMLLSAYDLCCRMAYDLM